MIFYVFASILSGDGSEESEISWLEPDILNNAILKVFFFFVLYLRPKNIWLEHWGIITNSLSFFLFNVKQKLTFKNVSSKNTKQHRWRNMDHLIFAPNFLRYDVKAKKYMFLNIVPNFAAENNFCLLIDYLSCYDWMQNLKMLREN